MVHYKTSISLPSPKSQPSYLAKGCIDTESVDVLPVTTTSTASDTLIEAQNDARWEPDPSDVPSTPLRRRSRWSPPPEMMATATAMTKTRNCRRRSKSNSPPHRCHRYRQIFSGDGGIAKRKQQLRHEYRNGDSIDSRRNNRDEFEEIEKEEQQCVGNEIEEEEQAKQQQQQ